MIQFAVNGPIRGKGRPRFNGGGHGRPYTPRTTKEYETQIRAAFLAVRGKKLEGAVAVRVVALHVLPKRASKACRAAAERGEIWPIRRPDLDNVIKVVLDALNGIAYADDAQVVRLEARKEYAADGVERLEICVGEVVGDGNV